MNKLLFCLIMVAPSILLAQDKNEPQGVSAVAKPQSPNVLSKRDQLEYVTNGVTGTVTGIPRGLESVTCNGTNYNFQQAIEILPVMLRGSDEESRLRFVDAITGFGRKLQGKGVTELLKFYPDEVSGTVRYAIFRAVKHSLDPRFAHLCRLASNDTDPDIKIKAGIYLLESGDRKGLKAVSEALDFASERDRRYAVEALLQASHGFGLDFEVPAQATTQQLSPKDQAKLIAAEWKKWWDRNGASIDPERQP